MPTKSHHLRCGADTGDVAALLCALLSDSETVVSNAAEWTLGEFGIDAAGVSDLWAAVCEEFGEGELGAEIESRAFDPNMTVTVTAETMAGLLARRCDG